MHVRKERLGEVTVSPSDVRLSSENVLQPDIYFIRRERLGIVGSQGPGAAPDLVVEVISPGTKRLDLGRKKALYASGGVVELWAVYPEQRAIELYRLQESAETPAGRWHETGALTSDLLQAFALPLNDVFEPTAGQA